MNRRDLLALRAGTVAARPLLAPAQEPPGITRIGVLMGGTPIVEAARLSAFSEALNRLGHIDGQNIRIEPYYAEGVPDRLSRMAHEVMDRKPTVIVCVGG
jgi:putative tryptophan/tyrosine transport system substrate-binding protein